MTGIRVSTFDPKLAAEEAGKNMEKLARAKTRLKDYGYTREQYDYAVSHELEQDLKKTPLMKSLEAKSGRK